MVYRSRAPMIIPRLLCRCWGVDVRCIECTSSYSIFSESSFATTHADGIVLSVNSLRRSCQCTSCVVRRRCAVLKLHAADADADAILEDDS